MHPFAESTSTKRRPNQTSLTMTMTALPLDAFALSRPELFGNSVSVEDLDERKIPMHSSTAYES
uniref:Transposon Tn7 transposition protein tnsD n=1 Tax=mine drainage metagenome TaxID=410659 RepID=E6PWX7_9ZZZZ